MKRYTLLLCAFIALITSVTAQKMTRKDYIAKYKNWAIEEMKRTGIPASITIAQGLLESSCGNSILAKKANNHFGIKCHDWTGPSILIDDDKRNECFRKYRNAYHSFKDHSNFLRTRSRYAFLFKYSSTDYKRWAKGLKKAGYATHPQYAHRLIRIIEEEKLYLLDKKKSAHKINLAVNKTPRFKKKTITRKRPTRVHNVDVSSDPYGERLEETNGVYYIVVRKGDTFYGISTNLGVSIRDLRKYNELSKRDVLHVNQRIYLGKKKRKAARGKNYHIVKQGETLYDIAQLYCIRLKRLCKMNHLRKKARLRPGKRIYLRHKK